MANATVSTHTLEISGMKGDACLTKVTATLRGVPGIFTRTVKAGGATISGDPAGCTAACTALGAAGFSTQEVSRAGEVRPAAQPATPAAPACGTTAPIHIPAQPHPVAPVEVAPATPAATPAIARP